MSGLWRGHPHVRVLPRDSQRKFQEARKSEARLTAERGILGACCLDVTGRQASTAAYLLTEADFSTSNHRETFSSIRSLAERGFTNLDYVTVIGDLQARGVFESFGQGWNFVSGLGEGVVVTIPIQKRIRELKRLSDESR